jgi:hypothetical protein
MYAEEVKTMKELLAGYASYASTEAILEERQTAQGQNQPDSSITVTVTYSWSYSWSWTW